MADHSKPDIDSNYTSEFTQELNDRLDDLAKANDPANTTLSNQPTNTVRWNSANKRWELWDGGSWVELIVRASDSYAISVTHLGTVAADAYALSASPTFTGTPLAPTAAVDTNTTQIATTAYVIGQAYAKLASPTLTGTPAAPTASARAGTTQIATTAYADAADKIIPSNSKSAAYTTVLGDAGKSILHPASDANDRTFTIDSNANVAYPVDTVLTFINMAAANTVSIAITTDTMYLAESGTTGTRSLAPYGIAVAVKVDTTTWVISGAGLT